MQTLKAFLAEHFEFLFVNTILIVTTAILVFLPHKLALLNVYFLSVILAGYFLGKRLAILGSFLCILVVGIYVVLFPEEFLETKTEMDLYLTVMTWGGFLILAGATVGQLQERLAQEIQATRLLNVDLQHQQAELHQANLTLRESSENLVALNRSLQTQQDELGRANAVLKERSGELELSKRSIESLKSKVEETLYSTMDASVVNLLIEGRLRNEKRNLSVMFSDLVGFTTYSEGMPPEAVIRDLNLYIGDMEPILLNYRGHIDKYMGDGIMCEFGAPLEYETHSLLAVLAALKMQEKMAQRNYPWKMRIGIGSGSTITGLIGLKRQTFTAVGDVVNVAARLEKVCAPERILIDAQTYNDISHVMEAKKKMDVSTTVFADPKTEQYLVQLHTRISNNPKDASAYYEIGRIHQDLKEPGEALHYFEQALEFDKENKEFKMAYAEAGMKVHESERLRVKGKRHRVEAFEVIGLKDPLLNRDKIPQKFYDEFRAAVDLIKIPADVILPIEALDGSIGHSKTVAVLSYALAQALGLPEKDKQDLLLAGFFADIGKEIVPHYILNRGGSLSSTEFDLIKTHTEESARVMKAMGYENEAALQIVKHSHECFNGTGHPKNLKGDKIPIGSRIVAVADAYDALTSKRPYRDSWERRSSMDQIDQGAEKGLFDPKVVQALHKYMG
ncbi:MAG: HD domain-containing protein [Nitrospirae bacterium]|nr:HD domain-containing protein [Nitrospirota bacterium]